MNNEQKQIVRLKEITDKVWTSHRVSNQGPNQKAVEKITEVPAYVDTTFRQIEELKNSPYLLISAPGAVGKTTFARYLSYYKRAYYWDLSQLKLGDNTFVGTLVDYFGAQNLSKVIDKLKTGEIVFVFDAFDEAEIISGWEGVENFLKEIHSFNKESSRVNVIFLSRSETAGLIQLTLESFENLDSFGMYEIDYFDKEYALKFIEVYLRSLDDKKHIEHNEKFLEAVDKIFETIIKGLVSTQDNAWNLDVVRSFLGYAPVLQTVASYLHDSNYQEVINYFDDENGARNGVELVSDLVEELLKREQDKVVKVLKENSSEHFDGWEFIYDSDIQIQEIIRYISSNGGYEPKDNGNVPDFLKSEYLDALNNFLPNHPFLRKRKFSSPSFRDYSLGYMLGNNDNEKYCLELLSKGKFVLTPLFAFFYKRFNDGVCQGPHVGIIYDSVCSKLGFDQNSIQTFIKDGSDNKYKLEILSVDEKDPNNIEMECEISENNPLTIERRLSNALIHIDGTLVLGKSDTSIELNEVEIIADSIILKSKECVFNLGNKDHRIGIKANNFKALDHGLTIRKIGFGDVIVDWPGAQVYPWSDYYGEINLEDFNDVQEELYSLCRIFAPFRKHKRDTWGKYKPYVDDKVIGGNELRKSMLEYLVDLKVIHVDTGEQMYFLNEDALNDKGINWSDLRMMKYNKSLKSFLVDFKMSQLSK